MSGVCRKNITLCTQEIPGSASEYPFIAVIILLKICLAMLALYASIILATYAFLA